VRGFLNLIEALDRDSRDQPLPGRVEHVVTHSGLLAMYEQAKADKGEMRAENLEELINASGDFTANTDPVVVGADPTEPDWLNAFLAHAALESGQGQGGRRGLRATDDAAHGQGTGVPAGVPGGDGRRSVPAQPLGSGKRASWRKNGDWPTSGSPAPAANCTCATPSDAPVRPRKLSHRPRASSMKFPRN
jgi:hypothetical protein